MHEAELACNVLDCGHESAALDEATRRAAEWCVTVANSCGEQRVREAIAARLIEWALR